MSRIVVVLVLVLVACVGDSTGPRGPEPPALGEYQVAMSGIGPGGTEWSRKFGLRVALATRDSLRLQVFAGDLPLGMVTTARLIDWGERDYWRAIFGLFNGPDVMLNWYPDNSCTGRLFYSLENSYGATECSITRLGS